MLVPHDCYGGSCRLFTALAAKGAFELESCDFTDGPSFQAAIERKPKPVWVATPSNPLLRITDLAESGCRPESRSARRSQQTFLSPALQRPIEHGADIVVHSTTNISTDIATCVGGAAIARDQRYAGTAGLVGQCAGPYRRAVQTPIWTLRGFRTLEARLSVQQANCAAIAEVLDRDPRVAAVHYPGLPSHPGHALAAQQQDGFGAMLSLICEAEFEAVQSFTAGLTCITVAKSLGGVESLVAYPVTMSHAALSEQERARAGIGKGLLRLWVGSQNVDDLTADIREALLRINA